MIADEALGRYGFPDGHPFGTDRQAAFLREFRERGLHKRCLSADSRECTTAELLSFHTQRYVDFVRLKSVDGQGSLASASSMTLAC